jgi:hypothetical protein
MIGIAAGIEATGALDYLSHYMLSAGMDPAPAAPASKRPDSAAGGGGAPAAEDGRAGGGSGDAAPASSSFFQRPLVQRNVAKVRMFSIVAIISAFINNT